MSTNNDWTLNVVETKNTVKVIDMLQRHTHKEILTRDIREFSGDPFYSGVESYLGALFEGPDSIIVYLNSDYPPAREATFIHEILHKILDFEGYPNITINETIAVALPSIYQRGLPKLQSKFSSVIDHPEIFRRMESDFDLDIASYCDLQVQQKLNRFSDRSEKEFEKSAEYYFYAQQDILTGLEYFFYPQRHREEIQRAFKEFSPEAYASCSFLYNAKLEKIGFNTPESNYESAKIVKDHIIKYGEKKTIGIFNKMWEALEIEFADLVSRKKRYSKKQKRQRRK